MDIRFMDYKHLPAGRQVGGQYKFMVGFIYLFLHTFYLIVDRCKQSNYCLCIYYLLKLLENCWEKWQ